MANLMNAIPQASNNSTSPLAGAKLETKELKELFQKQLAEKLTKDVKGEKVVDEAADLAAIALAAGALGAPKVAPTVVKLTGVAAAPVDKDAAKAAMVVASVNKDAAKTTIDPKAAAAAKIQVQNQLKAAGIAAEGVGTDPTINPEITAEMAALMGGEDLSTLSKDHKFDVESLNVKTVVPKELSSKLSTADYLNLREISQNPLNPNVLAAVQSPALTDTNKLIPLQTATAGVVIGMKPTPKKGDEKQDLAGAMNGLASAHSDKQVFGKTMDATVTQTAGQKAVLSPASMTQIGNQVNLMGQARQDGEIKIRLRPDHLGELQMSVRTQGQNVSIQIKAENNEAKKIIEDSLGALREHLSLQNLSLARIDVVTQPTTSSTVEQNQMRFDANQNFNQSTNQGGRQGSEDGSQQSRRDIFGDAAAFASGQSAAPIRPRTVDTSRLDLIA